MPPGDVKTVCSLGALVAAKTLKRRHAVLASAIRMEPSVRTVVLLQPFRICGAQIKNPARRNKAPITNHGTASRSQSKMRRYRITSENELLTRVQPNCTWL